MSPRLDRIFPLYAHAVFFTMDQIWIGHPTRWLHQLLHQLSSTNYNRPFVSSSQLNRPKLWRNGICRMQPGTIELGSNWEPTGPEVIVPSGEFHSRLQRREPLLQHLSYNNRLAACQLLAAITKDILSVWSSFVTSAGILNFTVAFFDLSVGTLALCETSSEMLRLSRTITNMSLECWR